MSISYADGLLQHTIEDLEGALLTPVVAGELLAWAKSVQQAASTFGTDWMRCVRSDLHPKYKEIAKTESDLLRRVEQMLQTDQELFEALACFQEQLADLARLAELAGKDESRLADRRQAIEADGIAMIVRIKKQQASVATWLSEAHCRDQGVGD